MNNWQAIASAPKGAEVLVFVESTREQFVALWSNECSGWQFAVARDGGQIFTRGATHWMPLPTPPAS